MSAPLLTALVPVKEFQPEYLRQAIRSLLDQTDPNWRALIVHAAGMRPEVQRGLNGMAGDPRIGLVTERGRKLAGALNTGMRVADTEFTAILLGDDLWTPEAVAILNAAIRERPEADFFHSARRVIDDAGRPISAIHPAAPEVRAEMFLERGPVKHLLCWRRELALSIGGVDETLNSVGADDYDFPWSMFEAGARFVALQDCLYIYRDHRAGHRLTTHLPLNTHLRETARILRKHGVPDELVRARLASARASYLRQCLYSSRLDAWIKRIRRHDPRSGWRDSYI